MRVKGEEILRLSDDMEVLTFYDDNEVVLTLRVDGVGRFAKALHAIVNALEAHDADYATGWTRMDAVETVKEALGIEEPSPWPEGGKTWYDRWRERAVPADEPLEDEG